MGDFAKYTMRVARKAHPCAFCEGTIEPGAIHMSIVCFDLGKFSGGRLHRECWRAENYLLEALRRGEGDELVSIHEAEDEEIRELGEAVAVFRPHADRILAARAVRRAA